MNTLTSKQHVELPLELSTRLKIQAARASLLSYTAAENAGLEVETAAQALVEASILAQYRFEHYRSDPKSTSLKQLIIVENDPSKLTALRSGVKSGRALASATSFARDLINHPGQTVTPVYLASEARRLARAYGIKARIMNEKAMAKMGMGALMSVGQGSANPPRFICMEYNGHKKEQPLVFVSARESPLTAEAYRSRASAGSSR